MIQDCTIVVFTLNGERCLGIGEKAVSTMGSVRLTHSKAVCDPPAVIDCHGMRF
jgi:hypothetical protein